MGGDLFIAKINRLEFGEPLEYENPNFVPELANLFESIEISCGKEGVSDYEVYRPDLTMLKRAIENGGCYYDAHKKQIESFIEKMEITMDGFLGLIERLITESDQENYWIRFGGIF